MAQIRLLASLLACCALVAGCRPGGGGNDVAPVNASESDVQVQLPPPVAPKILDRAELLLAVGRSASAFALGRDDSAAQRTLDGQQYEFRIRFGCPPGDAPGRDESFSVAFDEAKRTLRLGATPGVDAADPLIAAVAAGEIEAVEGFWVEQPWLLDVGCPKASQSTLPTEPGERQAEEPAPAGQAPPGSSRIGIAQFFGADESRTLRRNSRAYRVTETLADDVAPSAVGYDLVLSGRLRRLADGRVIACAIVAAAARPSCVVSASFDRVSIRRGDNDELLAEWGGG